VTEITGTAAEIRIKRPADERESNLLSWWIATAVADFDRTVPKALEYGGSSEGSADLQLIGENLATLLGMHEATDAVKQELACWFYMQGKVARLVSDYQQHRPGKPDSWFDAQIYAVMARRIQETGNWP
jgi:hypothetical protein